MTKGGRRRAATLCQAITRAGELPGRDQHRRAALQAVQSTATPRAVHTSRTYPATTAGAAGRAFTPNRSSEVAKSLQSDR